MIKIPEFHLRHAREEIVEYFYGFIGSTWKIPEGMITD
jgi:hypothetical protein